MQENPSRVRVNIGGKLQEYIFVETFSDICYKDRLRLAWKLLLPNYVVRTYVRLTSYKSATHFINQFNETRDKIWPN